MRLPHFLSVLVVFVVAFSSCKKEAGAGPDGGSAKTIADFTVRNGEIAGWSYGGSSWTANNISELTTYIDGLADIYRRHGFVEAAHQEYQGTVSSTQAQLKLTVFNQATPGNAAATYADPDLGFAGALDWTGGAGEAAHYVRNGGLSQVLSFHRGSYFVYLEMSIDTEESLNVMKQFALNVDGKIRNG